MLLNELKRLFETDRNPLESGLAALDLNFNPATADKSKAGDVDTKFQQIVEKYVVVETAPEISARELKDLTSTPEVYEDTIRNLGKLSGTLKSLEEAFTNGVAMIGRKIEPITGDSRGNLKLLPWLQLSIENMNQDTSREYTANQVSIRDAFSSKKDNLVRTLMKLSNTESYGRETVNKVKNFSSSPEWFEDDGTTVKMSGVNTLRSLVLTFYGVLITMQKNVKKLADKVVQNKPT